MTGDVIHAVALEPGDVIHREPHRAHGRYVPSRHLDVQVDAVDRDTWPGEVAIDWREPDGYLGAQPTVTGRTVYDRTSPVCVIGHVRGAA